MVENEIPLSRVVLGAPSEVPVLLAGGTGLIDRLRNEELESLASEIGAGRRDHILKSLDERGRAQELVRQQYSGRYPFELLQNANDASADAGVAGRARFVLTNDALVAADNGSGFGEEQIRAICGLGRSSKDPRKSVGYKGLGFKSVGEITTRPQIISGDCWFEFDEDRAFEVVESIAGALDERQRLPVYALPFGIDRDCVGSELSEVESAIADGFTTVLRLPLMKGVERADVETHLVDSLVPRLLLFLPGVEELELRGTGSDFVAVISRERHPDHEEVLLETNGALEHWLVYRRWHEVPHGLVEPIGDAWAQVERVQTSVGIPLDGEGRPAVETLFPVHVYFPTEEATGLPLIVHGDFALQLDRRQLATTPEAMPYNSWLVDQLAQFISNGVAPSLAARYPSSAAAVSALTPRASATGTGARVLVKCIDALRSSRFLPTIDGELRIAGEVLLLPERVDDPVRAHRYLDLDGFGRLIVPELEADTAVRRFVQAQLQAAEWALDETLEHLAVPARESVVEFFEMLVDWADRVGTRVFAAKLARVPCVSTASGDWVCPGDGHVFFPRQRNDVEIPVDLPVPIADVPDVDGLHALLAAAGVRDFEWRELLRDYLLPLLTSTDTDGATRDRAMRGLRSYFESQRAGDPVVQRRLPDVLLRAASADGTRRELVRAGSMYFPSSWTGSLALETLYGPFDRAEFLDVEIPADSDERTLQLEFFRWVGVVDHPRVLEARAAQGAAYMTSTPHGHPHSRQHGWWEWWRSAEVAAACVCPQGHPASQQVRSSFALDRFHEICHAGDPARLAMLWAEVARNWGSVFEPASLATFHCQNTAHGGERDRSAPSLLMHQVTCTPWVPAFRGGELQLVAPGSAWRLAPDRPRWIARRVPAMDRRLLDGAGLRLAVSLGVVDGARPEPHDLCTLLDVLQDEYESSTESSREIQVAARWAMRTLNDVLADNPADSLIEDVALLARFRGEAVFTSRPLVAIDPLLAETWEEHYPILDADRDLRRLHDALDLVVLDDPEHGVTVTPIPHDVRADLQERVERLLAKAKPYLAAVAVASAPSREDDVLRGLSRLEVTACTRLVLRQGFDGKTIDRTDATSFISVRQELIRGAARRNIGTAHLEVDPASGDPDWYSFGPQLAQFLQVPTQGDAFSVLLTGSDADRARYLTSRRVSLETVSEMRARLDLPIEDEISEALFDFLSDGTITQTPSTNAAARIDVADTGEGDGPQHDPLQRDDSFPEIAVSTVTIEDAVAGLVQAMRPTPSPAANLGPAGPIDHGRIERRTREIGRRGELAAVEAERRRLQAAGLEPSAVVWRSERNPLAPYDIESIDLDGQRIYIEVKATTSEDAADPFVISEAELLQALRHRSRFFIYRVTRADSESPKVYRYQDPAGLLAAGRADLRLSDARLRLGPAEAS